MSTWILRQACFLLAAVTLAATALNAAAAERPNLTGNKAPAFTATTTAGKTVNFPDAFKGKIVLLDFWAMWCPPCRAEIPNLAAAYQKYQSQGFEVLGVSLDRPGSDAKLTQFTKDNHMGWPQIYDGKYWKAAVAQIYQVNSIPRPLLVDGDTGVVLADGPDARGPALASAIEKALAAKKK